MEDFNYLAILVASISGFALGAIWYGPLFGKAWMAASGMTEEEIKKTNFAKVYGVSFVMNFLTAFVLAHVLAAFAIAVPDTAGVWAGVQGGFWSWLGFIMTTRVTDAMFERTSNKLLWINNGYRLVMLIIMGVILAVWK